jgi:hypothetical protein
MVVMRYTTPQQFEGGEIPMKHDPTTVYGLHPELALPQPAPGSRWRWTSARRVAVGGGVLAAAIGLGGAAAGASTPHGSKAPPSTSRSAMPPGRGQRPMAGGKVTALSGDLITVESGKSRTSQVEFTSGTTFRTTSGTTTSADLKVGEFIAVEGTRDTDGTVNAKSIMISATAPGKSGGPPGRGPGPSGR